MSILNSLVDHDRINTTEFFATENILTTIPTGRKSSREDLHERKERTNILRKASKNSFSNLQFILADSNPTV